MTSRIILSKSGILLFLAINLLLVVAWLGLHEGIALYLLFLLVALSPLGESLLRFFHGCRPISRVDHITRIEPIFNEVIFKAHQLNPHFPKGIDVYISNEEHARIHSIGAHSIVIPSSVLARTDDEIKAMLAHEFGHLTNHDSTWIMMASVGNVFISALFFVMKLFVQLTSGVASVICPKGFFSRLLVTLFGAITLAVRKVLDLLSDLWNKLMQLLINWSLREDEYFADMFAYNMGYGHTLCQYIETSASDSKSSTIHFLSPYQDPHARIQRLQEAGCDYKKILLTEGRRNGKYINC